jgi:hypothetical protein
MIDFDALVLGPAYDVFGVDAGVVLDNTAGTVFTLRVQDCTKGVLVSLGAGRGRVVDAASGDATAATLRPAAAVRLSDLAANDLEPDDLKGGTITLRDRGWRIKGWVPKPSDGEGTGEVYLLLEGL